MNISFRKTSILLQENEYVIFGGNFGKRNKPRKPVAVKRIDVINQNCIEHEKLLINFYNDDDENKRKMEKLIILYFGYEYTKSKDYLLVAMESFHCTLEDIFVKKEKYSTIRTNLEKGSLEVLLQITKAIECLHSSVGVAHRDLKPSNVVVKGPGRLKDGHSKYKIANIRGATQQLSPNYLMGWAGPEYFKDSGRHAPQASNKKKVSNNDTNNGNEKETEKSSDIFSLACIFFYTLTSGRHPFGEIPLECVGRIARYTPVEDYYNQILNAINLKLEEPEQRKLGNLITAMIAEKQEKRPKIESVISSLEETISKSIKPQAKTFFELTELNNGNLQIQRILTTLSRKNMNGGCSPVQDWGKYKRDKSTEASHLIAQVLGGSGTLDSNNIVFMHRNINRKVYKGYEMKLRDFLKKTDTAVHLNVIINEGVNGAEFLRPKTLRIVWCSEDQKESGDSLPIENTKEHTEHSRTRKTNMDKKLNHQIVIVTPGNLRSSPPTYYVPTDAVEINLENSKVTWKDENSRNSCVSYQSITIHTNETDA